jgi:uncharacterized membrane protein YciS (DUF1049 family)
MKLILQIAAFLAIFGVIYLAIMNGNDAITLNLAAPAYDSVAQTTVHTTKTLNIAFLLLLILGAGIISGICLFVPFYLAQTEQLYAYKRELEKSSIKSDNSNSQVKVLQAKIDVLEKALKDALNR